MHNAGVKISDNPDVLAEMIRDKGKTVIAIWNRVVPLEVQSCLDAVDVRGNEFRNNRSFCGINGIREMHWSLFPELKTYFEYVAAYKDLLSEITGEKNVSPRTDLFYTDAMDYAGTWHSHGAAPGTFGVIGITVNQSHTEVIGGGEMEFVDAEDAGRVMERDPRMDYILSDGADYICKDQSVIHKMPHGAAGLILCHATRGVIHRGRGVPSGIRWRTTVEIEGLELP